MVPDTAVILCGGRGTRLQEHAAALPKPLVEVGGRPIVWHVVSIYAAQGVRRILLLTGFRSALVAEFAAAADWPAGLRVECVDTGLDTPTGSSTATLTVVRPELPFGVAVLGEDDRVTGFREKPRAEHWVNGGFFLCEPGIADYLAPGAVLERGPLERLAADGRLHAHRHEGFWACMDTYKDAVRLNDLWAAGEAPWS